MRRASLPAGVFTRTVSEQSAAYQREAGPVRRQAAVIAGVAATFAQILRALLSKAQLVRQGPEEIGQKGQSRKGSGRAIDCTGSGGDQLMRLFVLQEYVVCELMN